MKLQILFSALYFLLISCNSDRAELRRIADVKPLMFQFGAWSRLTPEANQSDEVCNGFLYSKRDESYYCAGYTLSSVGEEYGGSANNVREAILIKFDRLFRVSWIKQLGLRTKGTHSSFDEFSSLAQGPEGNIYVSFKSDSNFRILKFTSTGKILAEISTQGCKKIMISEDRLFCAGRNGDDAYMAKYFLDLRMDWEKTLLTTDLDIDVNSTSGSEQCVGVSISSTGKIACAGDTDSSLVPGFSPSPTKRDGFLWLIDKDGNSIDLKQIGSNNYHEVINDVVFDQNENIILLGNYIGSDGNWIIPETVTQTRENIFLYRLNLVGSSYLPDSYIPHTYYENLTEGRSMTLTPSGKLAVCGETSMFISLSENNANVAPAPPARDVFIYLIDANSWRFEKGIQFGDKTKGRFDNLANQYCYGITHDQFNNFILGGSTLGSTHEPNAGGEDIMIWRVGPNLEF